MKNKYLISGEIERETVDEPIAGFDYLSLCLGNPASASNIRKAYVSRCLQAAPTYGQVKPSLDLIWTLIHNTIGHTMISISSWKKTEIGDCTKVTISFDYYGSGRVYFECREFMNSLSIPVLAEKSKTEFKDEVRRDLISIQYDIRNFFKALPGFAPDDITAPYYTLDEGKTDKGMFRETSYYIDVMDRDPKRAYKTRHDHATMYHAFLNLSASRMIKNDRTFETEYPRYVGVYDPKWSPMKDKIYALCRKVRDYLSARQKTNDFFGNLNRMFNPTAEDMLDL